MLDVLAISVLTLLLTIATPPVQSSVDAPGLERYEDLLMQGLYKRLAGMDSSLLYDVADVQERSVKDYYNQLDELQDEREREPQMTEIRDSEKIEHSSNSGSHGPIYMSGMQFIIIYFYPLIISYPDFI